MKNLLFLLILLLCKPCPAGPIAFFYALESDIQSFAKSADSRGVTMRIGDRTITSYNVGQHLVYAVKMGAGSTETAISVTALLAKFQCSRSISVGPVGALTNDWRIGQWGRVAEVVAYQRGTEGANGFSLAESAVYLIEKSKSAPSPESPLEKRDMTVASGEIFCASDAFRDNIRSQTGAAAVDMNLAGVLAACRAFGVSVVAWRVVSDHADARANEDFTNFVKNYDGAGGKWVADWIQHLPPDPADPRTHENLKKLLELKSQ